VGTTERILPLRVHLQQLLVLLFLLWQLQLLFLLLPLGSRGVAHRWQLAVFFSFKSSTDGAYILMRGQ
jgi:hypothetical protein